MQHIVLHIVKCNPEIDGVVVELCAWPSAVYSNQLQNLLLWFFRVPTGFHSVLTKEEKYSGVCTVPPKKEKSLLS